MITRNGSVLVVFGVLFAGSATAQDARSVLTAAADKLGVRNVRSIEYTGGGWVAAVGQSATPDDDWPRFEVINYTRTIDFQNRSQCLGM